MVFAKSNTSCLICLNFTDKNVLVPPEDSQKIFNVCCSYVKDSINVKFLIKNINEDNELSFCKNCLDNSLTLTQLVETLGTLKKEIANLTHSFSEFISKRRCEALANNEENQQLNNSSNCAILAEQRIIQAIQSVAYPSPPQLPLQTISTAEAGPAESNTEKDTPPKSLELESSNHLLVNPHVIELPNDNSIKYENIDLISSDNEDVDIIADVFGNEDESNGTNSLLNDPLNTETTESTNAVDPLPENIVVEPNIEIINHEVIFAKSKQNVSNLKCVSGLKGPAKIPTVLLERIDDEGTSSDDDRMSIKEEVEDSLSTRRSRRGVVYSPIRKVARKRSRRVKTESSAICKYCNKKFANDDHLKQHIQKHKGKKPYICLECKKCFRDSFLLRRHRMSHTGEKPFKCEHCQKSFTRLANLKNHAGRHTKKK